ncbi:RcnB family protein [Sphingomonas sp. ASY06-1R]|uniref:RcnB family protein n=1 Tax=Sphingomonas sp. ASY06-1R TaxID=3445771 RepID=UPI003FA1D3A9
MKKFLLAAVAASVIAGPVMAQPFGHNDRGRYEQRYDNRGHDNRGHDNRGQFNRYDKRNQNQYRSWRRGERFDHRYARNYRVISSPRYYRLNDAPRGYRWVQSGNDALLIGITSGVIASVLANAIY